MLSQRRLRRVQACGWLVSLVMLVAWIFGGWEPAAPAADTGMRVLLPPPAGAPLLVPMGAPAQSPASLSSNPAPPSPCPVLLQPAAAAALPAPAAAAGASGAQPPWPLSAIMYSTDGRPYRRLTLAQLFAWSPEHVTIVSGDTFRDRSSYVCDDDYGVGKARGCRFTSAELVSPARVFAKLPHHMPQARQILAERPNVKHVFVNGGGDTPLTSDETSALATNPSLLGFFSINVPASMPHSPRVIAIPLGVERTISPRGQYPDMYLKQRTGYNLAAKLCWAPVLAAELAAAAAAGGGAGAQAWPRPSLPLLYMNFRTETNEGVRGPARSVFQGKPWVVDNVNAGDAINVALPGGGVPELPLEAALHALWLNHSAISGAAWFRSHCGSAPIVPRGLDPALVPGMALPGYPLFLKAVATAPYVLAPEGNGVSTHRAWEVMYSGTLAVVKEVSGMADPQYRGLPAMMVSSWEEVTPVALVCYAVELFVKAVGLAAGGAAGGGAGFELSREGIAAALDALDSSRTLSTACAAQMAAYAQAHPNSHAGYLSLEALDYEWWHVFITRHTERFAQGL